MKTYTKSEFDALFKNSDLQELSLVLINSSFTIIECVKLSVENDSNIIACSVVRYARETMTIEEMRNSIDSEKHVVDTRYLSFNSIAEYQYTLSAIMREHERRADMLI